MPYAYHLFFDTPAHFGIESIGQERIELTARSDTLWGAIVQKWFLLFDEEPDSFCCNTGFEISSCFPLIAGKRFFPLPVGSIDHLMDEAAHMDAGDGPGVKKLKKIRFISESLLKKIVKGEHLSLQDISPDTVYPFEQQKDRNKAVSPAFSYSEQRPRLRTDQLNQGAGDEAFFYCSEQFFSQTSGLYFLTEFSDSNIQKRFEAALHLLGDSGLGADRSVGRGFFHFERYSIDVGVPALHTSEYLLLSLLRPDREEVGKGLLSRGRYSLVRRFGRAGSHHTERFRRSDCWMLEEGAVLPFKPVGTIPVVLKSDEKIPHNVYRYAKGFSLPVSIRG